jgi:alpha-ribazole phosphatase/probable phosphoglycerate mutase
VGALAEKLGQRRRYDGIAVVLTSDLGRAVKTAEIAFKGSGIRGVQDARLRECPYGQRNGLPTAQLSAERMRHSDVAYPDGESSRQAVERAAAFLTDVLREWDGARVAHSGHVATRWALDYLLVGVPLEDLVRAPFDWGEGWSYTLPSGWASPGGGHHSAP